MRWLDFAARLVGAVTPGAPLGVPGGTVIRVGVVRVLLAVAVSMTRGEFMEVQKLSPDDLRKRFGLAPTCDPAVTALTTEPAANRDRRDRVPGHAGQKAGPTPACDPAPVSEEADGF